MTHTRRDLMIAAGLAVAAAPTLGRTATDDVIRVRAKAGATTGALSFSGRRFDCAVGRAGIVRPKHEGDGGTPAGVWPLREVRFRPDRLVGKPKGGLPTFPAAPTDGWCDDPADIAYNHLVRRPSLTDSEVMWREDHLYDVLAVIGYNDAPTVPGAGSAIFLHVAEETDGHLQPTSGCVSLRLGDVQAVLAACGPGTTIDIRVG